MTAVIATLAIASVATVAHADPRAAKARSDASGGQSLVADQNAWGPNAGHKSLQWNGNGRWGLKLDYDQSTSREVQWKDVEAGAYYRITPSLRVGGGVVVGDQTQPRLVTPDEKPQPRVRLETTFRF